MVQRSWTCPVLAKMPTAHFWNMHWWKLIHLLNNTEQNNTWRIVMNITSFSACIWSHFPKWSLLYPAYCNYKIKTVISVSEVCLSWAFLKCIGLMCIWRFDSLSSTLCCLLQKHKLSQIFLELWVFTFLSDTWTNTHSPCAHKNSARALLTHVQLKPGSPSPFPQGYSLGSCFPVCVYVQDCPTPGTQSGSSASSDHHWVMIPVSVWYWQNSGL